MLDLLPEWLSDLQDAPKKSLCILGVVLYNPILCKLIPLILKFISVLHPLYNKMLIEMHEQYSCPCLHGLFLQLLVL